MNSSALRVAAYTGGLNVPSARYRVRQYTKILGSYGVSLHEFIPVFGTYPFGPKVLRPVWGICSLVERTAQVTKSYKYDVTLLQREMLSTLVTLEPMTKGPRVLDVDDAIWILREKSAQRLAELCEVIICGNSFLADRFSKWNRNVRIVATAVDTDIYKPTNRDTYSRQTIIGWSGTSAGFRYLYDIEESLAQVLRMYSHAQFRVISDRRPRFRRIPYHRIEFVPWSPSAEVAAIQSMDIGIMPLKNTEWELGKCGLKMLTYMACGVPVVASRIGTNADILDCGPCGFGANSAHDWICCLSDLLSSPDQARRFGEMGRDIVTRLYSVSVLGPRVAEILKGLS